MSIMENIKMPKRLRKSTSFWKRSMNMCFLGKKETFDIHIYKMYRTKVDWVIQLHEMRSFFRNVHILIK
jgi:hypothetical protein